MEKKKLAEIENEGEEEGSFESLEGKSEEYIKLIKEARVKFEEEYESEYYSRALLLIGHKLKDTLMKSEYKKMYDFVLPARRKAKSTGDKETYAKLVRRQLELLKEFYHVSEEAIEDAYGDPEKFDDSMEYWAEKDPEFPKKLETFMEVEAMTYFADEAIKSGKDKEVDIEKIIKLNEEFIEIFKSIGDDFKGIGDESLEIDLKFNWALDSLYEKTGLDLGVEKLVRDRFEDERYRKLRDIVSTIYNEGTV